MHQRSFIQSLICLAGTLAVLTLIWVLGVGADEVDSWFEHKIPSAEPQVTYDGKAYNLWRLD